jgi:hypothetical protein
MIHRVVSQYPWISVQVCISLPTAKDMAMLPRIHLTHKQTWHPHSNDDDDSIVIPPLITPAQLTYHSNSFDSKSDGTSGLRGAFWRQER